MTNIQERFNEQWWLAAVLAIVMFLVMVVLVIGPIWGETTDPNSINVATTYDLGVALVDGNQFVLPFEVASLLLTAAMIGAIFIARDPEDEEEPEEAA